LKTTEVAQSFETSPFLRKNHAAILTKNVFATFWAIFSLIHLVTLEPDLFVL
jgi:hypothetical protein